MIKYSFKITFVYGDGSSEYYGAVLFNSIPNVGDTILNHPVHGTWIATEVDIDEMTILAKPNEH